MTAVLRVKRKNTDSPLDRLVIACKRAKTGSLLVEESEPAIQTVVQFAGTLTDPTEDVAQHVAKVMPKMGTEIVNVGVKRTCDGNSGNISNKKWIGGDPLVERYKVVNCQHSQETLNEEKSEDKWLTLIDVEDCWSVSGTAKQNAEETEDIEDFVFDLYCGPTNDDVWFENNEIMVKEPEYPYLDSEDKSEEFSEDSNSESNWRNDYPDTDPDTDPDRSGDEDYDTDNSDHSNFDAYFCAGSSKEEEDNVKIYGCSMNDYRRRLERIAALNNNSSSSNDEGRASTCSSDESLGLM